MMPNRRLVVLVMCMAILAPAVSALADEVAESKIKNGKLLAEKALSSEGDTRADYAYKAKREFERAALAEPDNPWAYYWQAVVLFYIEGDSLEADRIYGKALEHKEKRFEGAPVPWVYRADSNVKAAFKGEFGWAEASKEEPEVLTEAPPKKEEPKPDQIEFLSAMIAAGDFGKAESLYAELMKSPQNQKNEKLLLNGLKMKLSQDSLSPASLVLADIADKKGRRSQAFRSAQEQYDARLDQALLVAKDLERDGNPAGAENTLSAWQPQLARPTTPARGRLIMQYASAALAQEKLALADSALALYGELGYEEGSAYKNLKAKLTLAQDARKPVEAKPEIVVASKPEIKPEKKPEAVTGFVTIAPPPGDIVKVVVNTINPATGRVESSDLWETAAPRQLKTGSAYRLVVQKKQERKAPKYIALAGILATFLIVR